MIEVIKNKNLNNIVPTKCSVDDTSNLAYKVKAPLPKKSFAMYVCGRPGSGKTTTWLGLLTNKPTKRNPNMSRYYYRYFSHIWLISCSLQTLPLDKLNLNEDRIFNSFNDGMLIDIIEQEREDENLNNLIILDDCIKDLNNRNSKELSKLLLNRRHCSQNPDKEGQSGLSVLINSQVYNLLPCNLRKNMSHLIIFRTENKKELQSIMTEVMADLDEKTAKSVLNIAWEDDYSFLFIDATKMTKDRYYKNFDKIKIY